MSVPSSKAAIQPRQRSFWIAVICGGVILTIGIGARQSFGIFQKPIAADLNVGREVWSFANALAVLLMGAFSPFVGNVADRFGTARTVAAGGVFVCHRHVHDWVCDRRRHAHARKCAVWHRHGGCGVWADLRLHQPADAARETLGRPWCRNRRRIVWSIRHRAVRVAVAVSARQLAYDHVHPWRDVDADGAACLRPPGAAHREHKARRGYPARQPKTRCRRRSRRKASGCSQSASSCAAST